MHKLWSKQLHMFSLTLTLRCFSFSSRCIRTIANVFKLVACRSEHPLNILKAITLNLVWKAIWNRCIMSVPKICRPQYFIISLPTLLVAFHSSSLKHYIIWHESDEKKNATSKKKERSQPTITWIRVEQLDGNNKKEISASWKRPTDCVYAGQIYLIFFVHAKTKSHLKSERKSLFCLGILLPNIHKNTARN